MPGIRVVTDSACDLLDETLSELEIGMVPLRIRFGDEELIDREELSTKEFWVRCASSPVLPGTAAPSAGQFKAEFERMADAGADGIVCINLSSQLSATIQSAREAAGLVADRIPVRVVDSLSVTLGTGLIVVEAARAALDGRPLDDVEAAARRAVSELKLYGAIDTLENLKKGGRIGGAAALVGSMLAIKPVIEVRDGRVEQESKQRTRAKSLRYLADKVGAAGAVRRLAVFSADAPDIDQFLTLLDGVEPTSADVLRGEVGPVIGAHAGPGALGVAWLPADPSASG